MTRSGDLTPGELWAREELERLQAAGFAPLAVRAFLSASLRRASATRSERPELARQSRRWLAVGAAAWCGLAAADRQPFRRRLVRGLVWWASVSAMLDWHLGMLETEDGRPRPLGAADALTLTRAWLVPVLIWLALCQVAVLDRGRGAAWSDGVGRCGGAPGSVSALPV